MPEFWEEILAVQEKYGKKLENVFTAYVNESKALTDWQEVEDLLTGNNDPSSHLIWAEFKPQDLIKETFAAVAQVQGDHISEVAKTGYRFDMANPEALKWIKDYGADEVKYVDSATKDAIKEISYRGYFEGYTPREQAQYIKQLIGLDPRRVKAVENYFSALLKKEELSLEQIIAKRDKYAKKLLQQRAMTIAINEASEASAWGSYHSTKDAYTRGVLPSGKYEGYRIITPDERLCKKCEPLAGEARQIPDGTYQSSGSQVAKLHILCRCVEGLREVKMKQSTKMKKAVQGISNIIIDTQALKRKEGVLYVPTVPLVEGVYEQWGIRVLRSYAEFSPYTHWLHGIPVVVNHEDTSDPEVRRIGQIFDPVNKPESLKTAATTRFYEIDLTQRELEELLSGKPHDGSLRWICYLEEEQGQWKNPVTGQMEPYDFKEVGPYIFIEYSFVKQGVISTDAGAGFNMQCKNCQKNHVHHAPGGADMEESKVQEMIAEAITPLNGKIAALEQERDKLRGMLTEMEQMHEADRQARVFEAFSSKLKPGYQAQAKELFEASQKDPLWITENADKFVQKREAYVPKGSSMAGGSEGQAGIDRPFTSEEMAERQNKIFGRSL